MAKVDAPISADLSTASGPGELRLPSLSNMLNLSDEDLMVVLQRYGILDNFPSQYAEARSYLRRMQFIGTPEEWAAEVENIAGTMSRRGKLGTARRVVERETTFRAAQGDMGVEFISVSDGDERTCEPCAVLAGEIRTLSEWIASGQMPGPGRCLGGFACRCDLVRID